MRSNPANLQVLRALAGLGMTTLMTLPCFDAWTGAAFGVPTKDRWRDIENEDVMWLRVLESANEEHGFVASIGLGL